MAASIIVDQGAAIPNGEGCGWGAAALGACRGLQRQGTLRWKSLDNHLTAVVTFCWCSNQPGEDIQQRIPLKDICGVGI